MTMLTDAISMFKHDAIPMFKDNMLSGLDQTVEGKGLVARGRVRHASSRQDICDVGVRDEIGAVEGHATVVFAVAKPPPRSLAGPHAG